MKWRTGSMETSDLADAVYVNFFGRARPHRHLCPPTSTSLPIHLPPAPYNSDFPPSSATNLPKILLRAVKSSSFSAGSPPCAISFRSRAPSLSA